MKQLILILITAIALTHQATGQVKPFGILQGLLTKYSSDQDAISGASLSGGVLLHKHWGLGLNVQAIKWYSRKYYLPVSFEASYFTKKKFSPYFNIQIGKGIYQHTVRYTFESGPGTDKIKGGYYFSPGAGMLLPFFGSSRIIVTAAYVKSQFKRRFIETGNPRTPRNETYSLDGYKIGLGFKF